MTRQKPPTQDQVSRPTYRLLRVRDAWAWVVCAALVALAYFSRELDKWLLEGVWGTSPTILCVMGSFTAAVNRLARVRAGMPIRDFFGYPKRPSRRWIALGGLGMALLLAFSYMFYDSGRSRSPLDQFSVACVTGAAIIFLGLIGKWTWREYRRWRFGETAEQLESREPLSRQQESDLKWEGFGALGMALTGLFLIVLASLGMRQDGFHWFGAVMILSGGGAIYLSLRHALSGKK